MTNGITQVRNAHELLMIQKLALSSCGLDLTTGKEELITARVGKVMRKRNIPTIKDYYDYVVADRSGIALAEMIDALTTNYTSFFRERAHFELLQTEIIPALSNDNIRIWSAACSTGEEPYSIAFCIHDSASMLRSAEVIATDISRPVLKKAIDGIYKENDLKGIPLAHVRRYFLAGVSSNNGLFKVKPEIRNMVHFAVQNLIEPLTVHGMFDVIFCRNVMIYFNKQTQQEVVHALSQRLKPGGYLLIGHSETLNGVKHSLRYLSPAVYRLSS